MKYLHLALATLLLAACSAVGPDYEQPTPDTQQMEAWNGRLEGAISDEELDPAVLAQWWTTLDDPLLDSLIERATSANLDLRTAESQLRQARAARGIAASANLPSLQASGLAESGEVNGVSSASASAGLDASWELDVFGGTRRGVEAAQADLEATEEARRDVLVSVLAEVALNYVDLRTLQAQRGLTAANLANFQESLALVTARETAGEASSLDVERASANVETTRAILPLLEQQLRQVQNRLAVLLGVPPGSLDEELGDAADLPVPPLVVAVGVPAEVLRRGRDVRRAERQLAAETARVGVAIAELYPKFSLGGTVGLQADSTSGLFENAAQVFGIGPRVQWNLFDGGRIRQQIEVQNAVQEQALIQYERAVLQALAEVDTAITAYTKEQLRHQSLASASESAARAAELAQLRFEAGETSFLSSLDAQRTQLAAEDQVAQSAGLIVSNLVRLYKALGGGWDSVEETE